MKKVLFLLVFLMGALLLSACSKEQPNAQLNDAVGKGSDVPQENNAAETTAEPAGSEVKEFRIEARQFLFDPGVIEVSKGDRVRLVITSVDVPHGFSILEYGINERLDVGKPKVIEFVADKESTFTSFCSVACGAGHGSMKGQLIVK